LAHAPEGVHLARFAAAQNARVTPPPDAIQIDGWAFATGHAEALADRVITRLAQYHESHPDEVGLERDRLRRFAAPRLDGKLFLGWLAYWQTAGRLARSGNAWHLPSHRVELTSHERLLADALLPRLVAGRFDPPWVRDLATQLSADDASIRQTLRKLSAQGEVFQVVKDLFYARERVAELVALVRSIAGAEAVPVKAAALRDATGLGRKRAIQILEFFDRVGFTRRIGSGQQQAHALRGEPPVA
jgi:selenocysteine-specific elongation factor